MKIDQRMIHVPPAKYPGHFQGCESAAATEPGWRKFGALGLACGGWQRCRFATLGFVLCLPYRFGTTVTPSTHQPELNNMDKTYKRFTVRGISDKPTCDVCGKTNLKLTIVIESESGELLHYGSDCAARTLRQDYFGKRLPISREAAISMGHSAKRGDGFAKLSMQVTA